MTSKIKSVSSPSHPIQYEAGDTPMQARIVLVKEDVGTPLVKNFELNIALAEPNKYVFAREKESEGKERKDRKRRGEN
jgi:hypothetical protein